ncbi:rhomboid family intramembrane serine protease [Fundidesulfovibrio agrisoli]|uniref:rhomboid family intramembrane serine protease n=1 Tax=Fundidesulfovibrio agrisoli TaxID=2922717 RepID=UPI001FAB572B|nr:rhomboid family intramembrane serine protease [Fundidesulfovibrio agrisoli]
MIPIKDNVPNIRKPVVVGIIFALNLLVFLFELSLPNKGLLLLLQLYGAVPARLTDPAWAEAAGFPSQGFDSAVTYMFLHGGWLHFLLNMWVLWVFADNVEDALGHWRFAAFYLLSGVAALAMHLLFNPGSTTPVVGASGAIAGVMGGYFRLFPHARVVTLIPIVFIPWIVELPAVAFLGIWFVIQLASGLFASAPVNDGQSVAWWAHAGGFLFGLLVVRLLGPLDCRYCYLPEEKAYDRR